VTTASFALAVVQAVVAAAASLEFTVVLARAGMCDGVAIALARTVVLLAFAKAFAFVGPRQACRPTVVTATADLPSVLASVLVEAAGAVGGAVGGGVVFDEVFAGGED